MKVQPAGVLEFRLMRELTFLIAAANKETDLRKRMERLQHAGDVLESIFRIAPELDAVLVFIFAARTRCVPGTDRRPLRRRLGRAGFAEIINTAKCDEQLATSRLLFLAEFLKTRITAERIEHRIEPEQRRSERYVFRYWARVRYRE
jgi:hypothetical protein